MSSKPYPEGVTKVLAAFSRLEQLNTQIADLHPKVVQMSASLKQMIEERADLERDVPKMLEAMDVDAEGNWGFGGRMGWLLAEMRRQIVAEAEEAFQKRIGETSVVGGDT